MSGSAKRWLRRQLGIRRRSKRPAFVDRTWGKSARKRRPAKPDESQKYWGGHDA